jgi:MFS family permease
MTPTSRVAGPLQGITLVLQVTLAVMGTAVLAPIIPQLIAQFHSTPNVLFWAPLVVTIPSLLVAVSAPAMGLLADMVGRRRLLMLVVGCYGALGVAPFFLHSLPTLLADRVALGVVEAGITTISTTLLADYFEGPACARWLGRQTTVASLSALVLLALGGWLGEFGWHAPFLVYAIALPLWLMLSRFTWEPAAPRREASPGWAGFPWLRFAGILGVSLVMGMMFYVVQIDLSSMLNEWRITSPARIGLITAATSIGIPCGTWVFQRLQGWPVAALLATEFGLLAFGFAGMSHAPGLGLFLALVFINQVGGGMGLPTTLTWAVSQLPFHQRGRGTGIWQAVFSLGPPAGPALLALIAQTQGGHFVPATQFLGLICAAMTAGALGAIFLCRARQ